MDDLHLVENTQLNVVIEGAEFAKEFNYFVTVQLEGQGEKRRTDISARVTNPVFTSNSFNLPLPHDRIELNMRLLFAVFVVADRDGSADQGRGQARLLGECVLELGPLAPSLTDIKGAGVKQHLRFHRNHEGDTVTVGRFLITLRLLNERLMGPVDQASDMEIFHPLPMQDPFAEFQWRARVDFRAAIDIGFNTVTSTGLPSPYMQFGWSNYQDRRPSETELVRTLTIPNNRHPVWNMQQLYQNPANVMNLEGFFWSFLKDRMAMDSLESILIPLATLRPFHPVHLEMISSRSGTETEGRCHIFQSLVIEEQITGNTLDHLVDIAIIGLNWDPVPSVTAQVLIAMTTHGYRLNDLPFVQVDMMGDDNLSYELMRIKAERHSIFMTPILSMVPKGSDNPYGAQAVFTVPRSFLDNQLSFYVIVRDESLLGNTIHPFPNQVAGHTDILDDQMQTSLQQLVHSSHQDKAIYVPVAWDVNIPMHRILGQCRCTLQLSVHGLDDKNKRVPSPIHDRSSGKLDISYNLRGTVQGTGDIQDRGRWDFMSRELQQKQELVHRLMKENDEKSDALKLTGSEIIDLRRQIQLLQNENAILRKRLHEDDSVDVENLVSREVERMNNEELKLKIIKISHLYRNERLRAEEYEKLLKQAQADVTTAYQYKMALDQQRTQVERQNQKITGMNRALDKLKGYKATIQKQESVINKLEYLLKKTMADTKSSRDSQLEMERLRTENLELKSRLKNAVSQDPTQIANDEIRRLERLVNELRAQLQSKRPVTESGTSGDWEREKMELEVQLQRADLRVQAMQDELDNNATRFAKEIAHYKGLVAEKQSIIDTMQMDIGI